MYYLERIFGGMVPLILNRDKILQGDILGTLIHVVLVFEATAVYKRTEREYMKNKTAVIS
jgi:hypothetical protein